MKLPRRLNARLRSTNVRGRGHCCELLAVRGFAASWLFSPRRKALILLEHCTACPAMPNVRAEAGSTAKRQAREVDDNQRRLAGLVF